jgi:hypothetical protein
VSSRDRDRSRLLDGFVWMVLIGLVVAVAVLGWRS